MLPAKAVVVVVLMMAVVAMAVSVEGEEMVREISKEDEILRTSWGYRRVYHFFWACQACNWKVAKTARRDF